MEAKPIYLSEVYTLCQLPCKCRTCGNDRDGVCGVDKGDCENAQRTGRCPVGEREAWTPKVTTDNLQITEYTIADMVRDLREAFREQYGVEASISIDIFHTDNPELTREDAERLGGEMAKIFPGTSEMGHGEGEASKWFRVGQSMEERTEIVLFYKEAPNEQSN